MTKARDFALTKHAGQTYGKVHGYDYHLDRVVANLRKYGYISDEMIDAGYLHDTLEDTDASIPELFDLFGPLTTELVIAVTAQGETRAEKTAHTLHMLHQFPEAVPLKMADRLANMEFSRTEYDAGKPRKHIQTYTMELPLYAKMFEFHNPEMYKAMQGFALKV